MDHEVAKVVVEAVAKQLPIRDVYQDFGQPVLREAGGLLGDLAKSARLLLTAPIQYTAALQDRYQRFLEKSVRNVPEERQIEPVPQILGPVLEGIKFETEGSPLSDMFSNLLSKAMDKDYVHLAHPAFAKILQFLSPDEILILHLLLQRKRMKSGFSNIKVDIYNENQKSYVELQRDRPSTFFKGTPQEVQHILSNSKEEFLNSPESDFEVGDSFPVDRLLHPKALSLNMEHLKLLGLAQISPAIIKARPIFSVYVFHIIRRDYELLPWGVIMMDACSPPSAR